MKRKLMEVPDARKDLEREWMLDGEKPADGINEHPLFQRISYCCIFPYRVERFFLTSMRVIHKTHYSCCGLWNGTFSEDIAIQDVSRVNFQTAKWTLYWLPQFIMATVICAPLMLGAIILQVWWLVALLSILFLLNLIRILGKALTYMTIQFVGRKPKGDVTGTLLRIQTWMLKEYYYAAKGNKRKLKANQPRQDYQDYILPRYDEFMLKEKKYKEKKSFKEALTAAKVRMNKKIKLAKNWLKKTYDNILSAMQWLKDAYRSRVATNTASSAQANISNDDAVDNAKHSRNESTPLIEH